MLNLSVIIIVLTLVMGITSAANEIVDFRRVLLDHINSVDHVHDECNEMEWKLIEQIYMTSTSIGTDIVDSSTEPITNFITTGRRYLRSTTTERGQEEEEEREEGEDERILTTPAKCEKLCKYFKSGSCPYYGCRGIEPTNVTDTEAPGVNRHLHSDFNEQEEEEVEGTEEGEDDERVLTSAAKCEKLCANIKSGFCPYYGCRGIEPTNVTDTEAPGVTRRQLHSTTTNTNDDANVKYDETNVMPPCYKKQIDFINSELNRLMQDNVVASLCLGNLKETLVDIMCASP